MKQQIAIALLLAGLLPASSACAADATSQPAARIVPIDPPEKDFYAKRLDYEGIPIKAHHDVSDEALIQASQRLAMMLGNLPTVRLNLAAAGAELHIIGKDQVTSDLPEYQRLKGKPFDGKLTVDQRTRGLGGLKTSCGEENLFKLSNDRYRGRDICVHEFAHCIYNNGVSGAIRQKFHERLKAATDEGLWVGAYAATNDNEFFAEIGMWYFGTHGDMGMKGIKPAKGRDGLRAYDPKTFELLDEFYSGKMDVPRKSRKG